MTIGVASFSQKTFRMGRYYRYRFLPKKNLSHRVSRCIGVYMCSRMAMLVFAYVEIWKVKSTLGMSVKNRLSTCGVETN